MTERTLRVATWNVHGLRGGVGAVASAIRAEGLDIVLIQESGARGRLRELGRTLGWTVTADPRVFPRRRIRNALLARPGAAAVIRPKFVRFAAGTSWHPRGVLFAEIDERWTAVSSHLGLDGPERGRQVRELRSLLEAASEPIVLGADLNALPEDAGPRALAEQLTDVWTQVGTGPGATFPTHEPAARSRTT